MLEMETFDEWLDILTETEPNARAVNSELKNAIMSIPDYMRYEYTAMQERLVDGISAALARNSDSEISWELDAPFDVKRFMQAKPCNIQIKGYLKGVDVNLEVDKFISNPEHFKYGGYATMQVPYRYNVIGSGVCDNWRFKQPHLECHEYDVYPDGRYQRRPVISMAFGSTEYADSERMATAYSNLYYDLMELFNEVGYKVAYGLYFKAKDSKTFIPFIHAYLGEGNGIDYQ